MILHAASISYNVIQYVGCSSFFTMIGIGVVATNLIIPSILIYRMVRLVV